MFNYERSSYLNKEVTVRFGKLKMQLRDSMCWPHVNPVPFGAVGKDCQRRLLSRPRFVRVCSASDFYLKESVVRQIKSVMTSGFWCDTFKASKNVIFRSKNSGYLICCKELKRVLLATAYWTDYVYVFVCERERDRESAGNEFLYNIYSLDLCYHDPLLIIKIFCVIIA
jgi:hypothetical protein